MMQKLQTDLRNPKSYEFVNGVVELIGTPYGIETDTQKCKWMLLSYAASSIYGDSK